MVYGMNSVVGVNKFFAMNSNLPTIAILASKVFTKAIKMLPPVVLGLMSGDLYRAVQCIMGNGHIRIPPVDRQNDRHTRLKTLPTCNFVGGL